MSSINTLGEGFPLCELSEEPSGKRISGTVSVNNLAWLDLVDSVGINLDLSRSLCLCDYSRLGALGDDYDSLSLAILLWKRSEMLGNLGNVGRLSL